MYSITEEDAKIRFSEIIKVNVFSRPLLEPNYMNASTLIENIKQQNRESITDISISVKFISKNANTLEIAHSRLDSPIIIPRYGFHLKFGSLP